MIAWTQIDYERDSALSKIGVNFTDGHGMGVTISSMGKFSYQKVYHYKLLLFSYILYFSPHSFSHNRLIDM